MARQDPRYSRRDKIQAVIRLEHGETPKEVAADLGCRPNTVRRWKDILVAAKPERFPHLVGSTSDPRSVALATDAELDELSLRIKEKQRKLREKLMDRIDELIPDTTDIKALTVAMGIVSDKDNVAAGKPTHMYGQTSVIPDDATPAQLERTAEELRTRRLASQAEKEEALVPSR